MCKYMIVIHKICQHLLPRQNSQLTTMQLQPEQPPHSKCSLNIVYQSSLFVQCSQRSYNRLRDRTVHWARRQTPSAGQLNTAGLASIHPVLSPLNQCCFYTTLKVPVTHYRSIQVQLAILFCYITQCTLSMRVLKLVGVVLNLSQISTLSQLGTHSVAIDPISTGA